MKCISCESEINPRFKHAIEQNICPFCGGSIMEELLKSLLISLQDTMAKMQEYPDQLNDWLLSNHNYIKTDSPDLIAYVPKEALREMKKEADGQEFDRKKRVIKVKTENGEEEVVTEKVQSDSKTAGFFERAQLIKRGTSDDDGGGSGDLDTGDDEEYAPEVELQPIKSNKPKTFKSAAERTEHLKKLKKKIETEGSQAIVGEKGLAAMIDPEQMESADPQDVAAFQAALGDGDMISSALPSTGDDEDSLTSRVLAANLAAKGNKSKGSGGGYNEADVRALHDMHARVNSSRKNFEHGENRGKNGFSRS
jgi:hypothetical protein